MTIANKAFGAIGPKVFSPEGPFGTSGNFPFPSFDPGEVVKGDKESEFVYLLFTVTASLTLNQGDWLAWDNSFTASPAIAAASAFPIGCSFGTFFLGGRFGDPAAAPNANAGNIWSFTFAPGVYGVWAQRFGATLANFTGGLVGTDQITTSATSGALVALATPPGHSAAVQNVFQASPTIGFTANTTSGSNVLTNLQANGGNVLKGVVKGMTITGTGLPAGCFIADIGPDTITLGNTLNSAGPNATATGAAVTMTAMNGAMWATFLTGAFQAKVSAPYGVYPNATLTGTGVGASAVLGSIVGNPGNQVANVNVAFSATEATPVLVTATNYVEAYIRLPFNSTQT